MLPILHPLQLKFSQSFCLPPNEHKMKNNNMQLYVHRCHTYTQKKKKTQEQRTTAFTQEKGCTGFIDVVNFMTSQHMTQNERQA